MFWVDFVDLFSSLVFLDSVSPFNICCKAGLVVLDSLNFCLSEKLFISPSIVNEILAKSSNLGCRFFPFSTLNTSCHSLLSCRVSAERSAVKHMGFPLYVASPLLLLIFFVFSLHQFDEYVSWHVSPWVYPVLDSLCLLDLTDNFIFRVGEILNYNLFKNFLMPFLFLFFFWDPYNSNVGGLILSQRSLRPSSVLFILFTLFCSSEVISTILSSSSLFCFSASNILLLFPSRVFLISVIVLFVSVCLYFNNSFILLLGLC